MSIVTVVEYVSTRNVTCYKCFTYSLCEIYQTNDQYYLFSFLNGDAWKSMLNTVVNSPGYVIKETNTNLICDLACFFKNDFTLATCSSIKDAYVWYSEPQMSNIVDIGWLLRQLLLQRAINE